VLVGRQHAAARAARPSVADQRRWSTDVSSAAVAATTSTTAVVAATAVTGVGGTAATAAATVVRVAVATTTPSSPPSPDVRQSAVADQQRSEVHRENGQRTGLYVVGSGVRRRRRTTGSGDSQVNHACNPSPSRPPLPIIPTAPLKTLTRHTLITHTYYTHIHAFLLCCIYNIYKSIYNIFDFVIVENYLHLYII